MTNTTSRIDLRLSLTCSARRWAWLDELIDLAVAQGYGVARETPVHSGFGRFTADVLFYGSPEDVAFVTSWLGRHLR